MFRGGMSFLNLFLSICCSMGFPDEMIDMVLAQATQETSFQELVIQITDMMVRI